MIISFTKKFLFIRGRKVAGSFIEFFLSQICSGNDIVTPLENKEEFERVKKGTAVKISGQAMLKWINSVTIY